MVTTAEKKDTHIRFRVAPRRRVRTTHRQADGQTLAEKRHTHRHTIGSPFRWRSSAEGTPTSSAQSRRDPSKTASRPHLASAPPSPEEQILRTSPSPHRGCGRTGRRKARRLGMGRRAGGRSRETYGGVRASSSTLLLNQSVWSLRVGKREGYTQTVGVGGAYRQRLRERLTQDLGYYE